MKEPTSPRQHEIRHSHNPVSEPIRTAAYDAFLDVYQYWWIFLWVLFTLLIGALKLSDLAKQLALG